MKEPIDRMRALKAQIRREFSSHSYRKKEEAPEQGFALFSSILVAAIHSLDYLGKEEDGSIYRFLQETEPEKEKVAECRLYRTYLPSIENVENGKVLDNKSPYIHFNFDHSPGNESLEINTGNTKLSSDIKLHRRDFDQKVAEQNLLLCLSELRNWCEEQTPRNPEVSHIFHSIPLAIEKHFPHFNKEPAEVLDFMKKNIA